MEPLRRFPYPYKAMLALSSDIDQTSVPRFREVHRFLNTFEETSMGQGLGLDVGDSFWFYQPESGATHPERRVMSVFPGLEPDEQSGDASEILHYLRHGWIDTIHTYGNFSGVVDAARRCERRHAEAALDLLRANDLQVRVWINHGDRNNVQNIGTRDYMHGDRPGTDAYHWDLLRDHGVEFLWKPGNSFAFGEDSKVTVGERQDGTTSWEFTRFSNATFEDASARGLGPAIARQLQRRHPYAVLWHPAHLHVQLSERNLQELVEREQIAIVAQHFGSARRLLRFGAPAVAALRRLAEYQERGEILVARTARVLVYNRARDHVRYDVVTAGGRTRIDISAIDDPGRGVVVPSVDELAGLTFRVPDPANVDLLIAGEPVPDAAVRRNPSDGVSPSVGLAWHAPDRTDHTQEFTQTGRAPTVDGVANVDASIAAFLRDQRDFQVEGVSAARCAYALTYTTKRYAGSLGPYMSALRSLGFSDLRRGLDVGSGAGHWCLAFAQISEQADGIDNHPEFVELAARVAAHVGLADRVRFAVGSAEALAFDDETFNAVWSHSVLMFTETELAIREAARVLVPNGLFYCGYSSFGFRLDAVHNALKKGDPQAVKAQVGSLVGDRLYRAGLHDNQWSRTHAFTFDELIDVADVFGLRFVDRPGIQDGRGVAFGHDKTVDFLVRREAAPDAHTRALRESPWSDELAGELERLVDLGCARVVLDVLRERADDQAADARVDRLRLRAMVKSGQSRDREAKRLAEHEDDSLVRGLFFHDRRQYAAALDCYERVDDGASPLLPLLRACTLLSLGRDDEAERVVTEGADTGADGLACRIVLLELAARRGDAAELERRFAAVVDTPASDGS